MTVTFENREALIGALRVWVTERLAGLTGEDPRDIATASSIYELGLDSLSAVSLTADLEDFLGMAISSEIFVEHETIDAAIEYIATRVPHLSPGDPSATPSRPDGANDDDWFASPSQ